MSGDDDLTKIEFARKVAIALVKSPQYSEPPIDQLDQELKHHFASEKVLSASEFFFVRNVLNPSN